jgi:hypothetical protein
MSENKGPANLVTSERGKSPGFLFQIASGPKVNLDYSMNCRDNNNDAEKLADDNTVWQLQQSRVKWIGEGTLLR